MKAIIIGATGATGKDLLNLLLNDSTYTNIDIFVRNKPDIQDSKLTTYVIDFDKPDSWEHLVKGDVLFSCLGTTLRAAGSKVEQYKVDFEYQYNFARAAIKNGVKNYVLVSAGHASAKSLFFYSKMKGELEDAVIKLNFNKLIIFKPPLLIRKNSNRKAEVYAEKFIRFINSLGLLKSFKPMPTQILAQAMINSLDKLNDGTNFFEASEIPTLLL